LAKGNYREMAKVVSKVKAILKGVSTYFKCTYTLEGGRITIDFKRRAKEIISAYYDKDGIEKAFCCIKQPIGLRPIRHWLDGRVSPHIYMLPLISIECVVTNPKGDISTVSCPSPHGYKGKLWMCCGSSI